GHHTGSIVASGIGGTTRVVGTLEATGNAQAARGGAIEVDASRQVVVGRNAVMDASGGAGGGTVAVGTTLARAVGGPSLTPTRTAQGTLIRRGATISADATSRGNGGKVT